MSIAAQKILAVVFFVIGMTAFSYFWHWVVYDVAPQWALDAFFYFGLPVLIVSAIVAVYRHRKAGGHLRKPKDDYGFDD